MLLFIHDLSKCPRKEFVEEEGIVSPGPKLIPIVMNGVLQAVNVGPNFDLSYAWIPGVCVPFSARFFFCFVLYGSRCVKTIIERS